MKVKLTDDQVDSIVIKELQWIVDSKTKLVESFDLHGPIKDFTDYEEYTEDVRLLNAAERILIYYGVSNKMKMV